MHSTLAAYSKVVRGSTLKRLQSIPTGLENWKISKNAMSIADIAQLLVDADIWLFEKIYESTAGTHHWESGGHNNQ